MDIVTVDFFKGRREVLAFAILNPDNTVRNLTGFSAEADIRQQVGGTEIRALSGFATCTNGTTTFDGFAYNVIVDIPHTETAQWNFEEAYTDVIVKDAAGGVFELVRYFLKKIGTYTE